MQICRINLKRARPILQIPLLLKQRWILLTKLGKEKIREA